MKMTNSKKGSMDEFELALDECLQQLGSGKSSLGQCLARYPQFAAELRPLLETALRLQRGRGARPSGPARDRARSRLTEYIQSHPRQPRNVRLVPRLAFVVVALALAVLFAGTAFAQNALPGETLYRFKISSERVWRAASPDPVAVDITLADRRANEILTIAGKGSRDEGNPRGREEAEAAGVAAYNDVLDRLSTESKGHEDTAILNVLEAHQKKFEHAGVRVPRLDEFVAASQHGQGQPQNNQP